jgi:O-antigen/teichoic acid export membrane protein
MLYTVTGQLITIVFSFVLTRIYGPEEFGLFGLLISFPSLVSNLITLGFHLGIPAPGNDEDGAAIAFGTIAITAVMSTLLGLVLLFLVIFQQFGFGVLPAWSFLLATAMMLLTGMTSVFQYWCVRRQRFQTMGQGIVALNVTRTAGQIGLGAVSPLWPGLMWGELLGRAAQFGWYSFASWRDLFRFKSRATRAYVTDVLHQYRRFLTVLLPPQFLETAWAAIPIPVFNLLFGLAATGQYYLMRRVLDLPVAFISSTVGDAFYGKISEYARTDPARIRRMLVLVFISLTSLAAIGFAPLLVFGPTLFAFIFGEPWRQAGLMASIMVPPMVLQIGTSPVVRVFGVTKRPTLRYPFTIVEVVGGTLTLAGAWWFQMAMLPTVALLSLVHVVAYLVYITTAYIAAGHIDTPEPARDDAV